MDKRERRQAVEDAISTFFASLGGGAIPKHAAKRLAKKIKSALGRQCNQPRVTITPKGGQYSVSVEVPIDGRGKLKVSGVY